jgi:UDP-N-acetylmuramyl pentapeptide phosphotransferase/UDP-N-acetylglucosamine-1-phosphate transferase
MILSGFLVENSYLFAKYSKCYISEPRKAAFMLLSSSIILSLSALFFAYVSTLGLVYLLPKLSVIDTPNERSNHVIPTPRGGGLAIVFAVVGFLMVAGVRMEIIFAFLIVAGVSMLDDVKGLPASKRLAVHLVCALLASSLIQGQVFQGVLPYWADKILLAVLWAGYMNIYNFMDGIDEITSTQTFAICAGVVALFLSVTQVPNFLAIDAMIIASGTFGFWIFNRHPAKIFLGDVGSVTLGFVTGYLLVHLAERGLWMAALILPAFYVVDAGLTLMIRLMQGKRIWEAHSEHGYQKAVRAYGNHRRVVTQIAVMNMVLIVLSVASTMNHAYGLAALEAAYLLSWLFWMHLRTVKVSVEPEIIPPVQ